MVLDGALADAQIRRNVLAGTPGEHHLHHLDLTRRETLEMSGGRLSSLQEFAGVPREFQRPIEARDQFRTADRLLDEIDRAWSSKRSVATPI